MRTKFVERLKQEGGFTLIELLAVLSISAMVLGVISATAIFGFRSYHQITFQNDLRDEGDIVMSAVIAELYAFAPDRIAVYNKDGLKGIELIRFNDPEDPAKGGETLKKAIVISDGQLQIRVLEKVPDSSSSEEEEPEASYQSTSIKASITDDSYIGLDCEGLTACESGLVNIKLVLTQDGEGTDAQVELESRFGF